MFITLVFIMFYVTFNTFNKDKLIIKESKKHTDL